MSSSLKEFQGKWIWCNTGAVSLGHFKLEYCHVVKATDKTLEVRDPGYGGNRTIRFLLSDHGHKWFDDEEHAQITRARIFANRAVSHTLKATEAMREVESANERLRQINLKRRHPEDAESDDES